MEVLLSRRVASLAHSGSRRTSCLSTCRTSLSLVTSCGANCCPHAVKGDGQGRWGGGRYCSHVPLLCGQIEDSCRQEKSKQYQGRLKPVLWRAEQVLWTFRWTLRCSEEQGLVYIYSWKVQVETARRSVNRGRWSQSNARSPIYSAPLRSFPRCSLYVVPHPDLSQPAATLVIQRNSNTNVFSVE